SVAVPFSVQKIAAPLSVIAETTMAEGSAQGVTKVVKFCGPTHALILVAEQIALTYTSYPVLSARPLNDSPSVPSLSLTTVPVPCTTPVVPASPAHSVAVPFSVQDIAAPLSEIAETKIEEGSAQANIPVNEISSIPISLK